MAAVTIDQVADRNAIVDVVPSQLDGGTLEIYDEGYTNLLVSFTLPTPAFTLSAGESIANTISSEAAVFTGTAAVWRFVDSGATVRASGTVSDNPSDPTATLIISTVDIVFGAIYSVTLARFFV